MAGIDREKLSGSLLVRSQGNCDLRVVLVLICALLALLPYILQHTVGVPASSTWNLLGVPHLEHNFADLRGLTHALDCYEDLGREIYHSNPCDPYNRPYNYPSILLGLRYLGVGKSSTIPLGLALAAGFFAALFALLGRLSARQFVVYLLVCCSPPALLLLERGNIDIAAFILVVLAVFGVQRAKFKKALGYGCLLLGGLIKIYPAVTLLIVWREKGRAFLGWSLTLAALLIGWGAYRLSEINLIRQATPDATKIGYGALVFARELYARLQVNSLLGLSPQHFRIVVGLIGALIFCFSFWRTSRRREALGAVASTGVKRDAFRAGCAIFCGTYLLQSSFNYRATFLLLTLPFLFDLAASRRRISALARICVALIVSGLWLERFQVTALYLLDEVAWCLLFLLVAALLALDLARDPPWGNAPASNA